ncbi:MAG: GNAT family N-acetyltransferase, partial [Myxococcota bacterium]
HRACHGPTNRGQSIPLLQFATETIGHALRAAIILDGEPYPYDKWLSWAAQRTPAGARVEEGAQGVLELIAEDGLRRPGPESQHPLREGLHRIRQMLIEAAREASIEGPWLEEWWLYLDPAREAIRWTRWEEPAKVDSMVIDPNPTPEEVRFLESRLYEFNVSATGLGDGKGLSLLVRDDDGRIVAGLAGHTWGGCCVIEQLWVSEPLRGSGLGSRLVAATEQEARKRGCAQILVSTHSFQAPDFYTKHGFEQVAAWEDYPVGYSELFLRKRL